MGCGRWPDPDGAIGRPNVRSICVCVRINGDRLKTKLPARADDPQRDFSSIGHEQPFQEQVHLYQGRTPLGIKKQKNSSCKSFISGI
jgi:hypothetical protein